MVRRILVKSAVGLSVLAPAGCNTASSVPAASGAKAAVAVAPVDIGSPLFPAAPAEKLAAPAAAEELIVVPSATARLEKQQTVPAELDGYINFIGKRIPAGTAYDPNSPDIYFESQDAKKERPYRRLKEGDRVSRDEVVVLFNDLEVLVQIESAQKIMVACEKAIVAATKAAKAIDDQYQQLLSVGAAVSKAETLNLLATLARYEENVVQSEKEKVKAHGDESRAWVLFKKHQARSVNNGFVTKVMKSPGSFCKAGEAILEILSTDDLVVEGNLDAKDAWAVAVGSPAVVEPVTPIGPDHKTGSVSHKREVTGLAVTAHPGRPLVVSTSLDGTAVVWDVFPPADKPAGQLRLPHPSGVRSVAATPARKDAKQFWVATGGEDGKVRLWDVTNPDKLSDKPAKEFDDAHPSAVVAAAFSPDGKYLATAAGRDVWVWEAASGKKLYAVPTEHKDAVTAVRFTPQAHLITAGKDHTLRVWKLGDKAAALDRTFDHRKGNVETLGVSAGGGKVLFDQDDGRIDVLSLVDGRVIGTVANTGASARFAGFALFSPDDSIVLTANGDGDGKGELQLWTTPNGGRAAERRRIVTPYRSTPTCAAFGSDPAKPFVVVGTEAGTVSVWTKAASAQVQERTGTVTAVLPLDPKTVKIMVRVDPLPGGGSLLQNNASATIIIKPGEGPRAGLPPVPAGGATAVVAPGSGIVQAGGFVPAGAGAPVVVPNAGSAVPNVGAARAVAPVVVPLPPGGLAIPQVPVPSPGLTTPGGK